MELGRKKGKGVEAKPVPMPQVVTPVRTPEKEPVPVRKDND